MFLVIHQATPVTVAGNILGCWNEATPIITLLGMGPAMVLAQSSKQVLQITALHGSSSDRSSLQVALHLAR